MLGKIVNRNIAQNAVDNFPKFLATKDLNITKKSLESRIIMRFMNQLK